MRYPFPKSLSFYLRLAGSVAATGAATYCTGNPSLSFALLPATLTAFGSLFSDLAANEVPEGDEGSLADFFQNHDLTKAVGLVVQRVFEEVAKDLPDGEEKTALEEAAKCAVVRWQEVEEARRAQGLSVVPREELVQLFSVKSVDFGKRAILTEPEWTEYVEWLLTASEALRGVFVPDVYRKLAPVVARRLHVEFSPKLREVLKNYPAAQAGMYLLLLGEIRASQERVEAVLGQMPKDEEGRTQTIADSLARIVALLEGEGLKVLRKDKAAQAEHGPAIHELETHHSEIMGRFDRLDRGQEDTQKLLVQLVADFQELLAKLRSAPAPERETHWNVPPHNPVFTGREDVLAQVAEALERDGRAAISGMGGLGKTQTAIEYFHRNQKRYTSALWIQAGGQIAEDEGKTVKDQNRVAFLASVSRLADKLNLPEAEAKEPERVVAGVKRWLDKWTGWLLVLDNADDLGVVRDVLPSAGRGHVLLTTRAQSTAGFGTRIRLTEMGPEEGARLLLRRAGILTGDAPLEQAVEGDRAAALTLSEEMDGLPLALDQAGAYIAAAGITPAEYLDLYRREGAALREAASEGSLHEHPAVTATFSLAFKQVEERNRAAADLLRLCAFLAPDAIPEEILTKGAPDLGDDLGPAAASDLLRGKAIAEASRYSLLERDPATKMLSLHRLVQVVLKDKMDDGTRRTWAERAVGAVNRAFPSIEFANWSVCDRLLPNALACAKHISEQNLPSAAAVRLLNQAGSYLVDRGEYRQPELLFDQALNIAKDVLGLEHPDTLMSQNYLVAVYIHQGRESEAEPLCKTTLEARRRVLGPEHSDTLMSQNSLAVLYDSQSRLGNLSLEEKLRKLTFESDEEWGNRKSLESEAENLHKSTLEVRRRVLGPEHSDTLASQSNLASFYEDRDRCDEAEPLCEATLKTRQCVLGPEHPHTLFSKHNLAILYAGQRRYSEAESLYKSTLEARQRVLGPEHPDTLDCQINLALLYAIQGHYSEAESLSETTLETIRRVLGPEHPATLTCQTNLAGLYYGQGRFSKAEPLLLATLEVRQRVLGLDHPDTLKIMNILEKLYSHLKRPSVAEPLVRRLWRRLRKFWNLNILMW